MKKALVVEGAECGEWQVCGGRVVHAGKQAYESIRRFA